MANISQDNPHSWYNDSEYLNEPKFYKYQRLEHPVMIKLNGESVHEFFKFVDRNYLFNSTKADLIRDQLEFVTKLEFKYKILSEKEYKQNIYKTPYYF